MARLFPFNAADYLDTPAAPSAVNFQTLSFWLKLNGHGLSQQTFFSSYVGNAGQLVRLSDSSPGHISFFWLDVGAGGHDAIGATQLTVGVWYHICCTYNATTLVGRVYVNGALDGSATAAQAENFTATQWFVGIRNSLTVPADATIAEIAYWQTQVLSAAQIAALAKGASPLWMASGGSVQVPWAYWPLIGSFDSGINYSPGSQATPRLTTVGTVATDSHAPVEWPMRNSFPS